MNSYTMKRALELDKIQKEAQAAKDRRKFIEHKMKKKGSR